MNKNPKKLLVSITVFGLCVIGLLAYAFSHKSNQGAVATTDTSQPENQPVTTDTSTTLGTETTTTKSGNKYKDGTYTATGSYDSPGGPDSLIVTLTIKNNVVTASSVTPQAGDRTSARYQQKFVNGYQALVIGKNIDTLALSTVSGSSLTPIGFNDALAKIKAQAKA